MEDFPLSVLFEQACGIHSAACNSNIDETGLRRGYDLFKRCDEMIGRLGLFSSNETKEDVCTANLKYLLVPFYLGELMERMPGDDRILILQNAQNHLREFVAVCEALEFVPKDEMEVDEQQGTDTFVSRRARKIARFKRQRDAEGRLQGIKERRERRERSSKAASFSSPLQNEVEDALEEHEEEEREAWMTTVSLSLCKAFDLLEMLKKEEELLCAMKEKHLQDGGNDVIKARLEDRTDRAEAWHRDAAARSQYSKPAQPITCATFARDVIEGRANVSQAHDEDHQPLIFGPASLVNGRFVTERERLAAKVFQPGYRLPSVSIEEAGLREMEMMQKWQEGNLKYLQEINSSWCESNSREREDDNDDRTTEKARAWDDWKDENPRGAGNKKLTPCG